MLEIQVLFLMHKISTSAYQSAPTCLQLADGPLPAGQSRLADVMSKLFKVLHMLFVFLPDQCEIASSTPAVQYFKNFSKIMEWGKHCQINFFRGLILSRDALITASVICISQ